MRNPKLLFSMIVLGILVVSSCSPQNSSETIKATQKCELALKEFPAFRGLKIGMPFSLKPLNEEHIEYNLENNRRPTTPLPKLKIENAQELGYKRRSFVPKALRDMVANPQLADAIDITNLAELEVETFDDKLVSFHLSYDKSQKAPSAKDTVYRLADALKLPREAFEVDSISSYCFCKDFSVHIFSGYNISLYISPDTEATYKISDALIERDKIREEKKNNTFTP